MTLNLIYKSKKKDKASKENEISGRRRLTDSIYLLVSYAEIHGSKGAKFYYSNISKLINSCAGITDKENITKYQISMIEVFQSAIIGEISKGIYMRKHYKAIYQDIKSKLTKLAEYI